MKTKFNIFLFLFLIFFAANAQNDLECKRKLSIFFEAAKVKNFDAAYTPWMYVRETCPSIHVAVYKTGAKILKNKITSTTGAEQEKWIQELIKLHKESAQYMPTKFKTGNVGAKIGQLMVATKTGTVAEQYKVFNDAFTADVANFNNSTALYSYYTTLVTMFDNGTKSYDDLLSHHTAISAKANAKINAYNTTIASIASKESTGVATAKELKKMKRYKGFVEKYSTVVAAIDQMLNERSGCDRLVPMFEKEFDANKADVAWLREVAGRLSEKDCVSTPFFEKVVESLNALEPSAKTAYYLGVLKDEKGESKAAMKYYEQSAELQTDKVERSKIFYKLAKNSQKNGRFSLARKYAEKAVSADSSCGKAYLMIAKMYAGSANSCGKTTFDKKATFWLAASMARKAGNADSSLVSTASQLAKRYTSLAPSKQEIFTSGMAGKTVKIGGWISRNVSVPNL